MKKILIPSLIAALLLVSVLFVSPAGAKRDPFVGVWTSIDIDGSSQRLTIGGGGGVRHVRYYDDGATICGLDPDTGDFLSAASARGSLSVSGFTLSGNLPVYCQTAPPALAGNFPFTYVYDPSTNTLTDWLGVVWSR
ncbi:MAG: hypothetical protein QY332_16770 [Anaerolineales bacterium]|nr:MAG: hypothetical protein QY332_16770 [Anaerolineales bacterium]